MIRASRTGALLGLVGVGFVAAWAVRHLEVDNDITAFLPAGADRELAALSTELARSELTRTVTLAVTAPDEERTIRAASSLAAALRASPAVAWVRGDGAEGLEEAVHRLYFPRRMLLLSDDPETELPRLLSDEGLARAAEALKGALGGPTGAMARAFAAEDPLMAFAARVERLEQARMGDLRTVDGQLLARDGWAIVFFASRESPFDGGVARVLAADVEAAVARASAEIGAPLRVEQDGVYRMALASERSIRADIERISALSTLGIVLLFSVLFRSPRTVVLMALPVGVGVTFGMAASILAFGSIHGLTLAFGSTLIGVCIDYPVHLANHHFLEGRGAGERSLRALLPGLLLGAGTTVAGFVGLAWTSFPGLREMAVFASVGVLSALGATVWLVAPLLPDEPDARPLQGRAARALERAFRRLRARRGGALLALVPLLAVSAAGWTRLHPVDDVRALDQGDEALRAEAARVRGRVSTMEPGRFVVSVADDPEAALVSNDRAFELLEQAREAGEVGDFRSLHPLLPSASLQRRAAAVLDAQPDLGPRLDAAFARAGFRAGSFAPFAASVDERPTPLVWDDLASSPLADLTRSFRATVGERVAFLTFLRDVRDSDALAARFEGVDGVYYFDQMQYMQGAYRQYRERTVEMILVGLGVVLVLVLARYRSLRLSLAALLPAVLAAGAAVGILGWLGMPFQLLHVVALLLVLSIGADYGVFMVEHRRSSDEVAATFLGLVVASATTVLSFGLLALSEQPALRAIGVTVSLGVALSFSLAPLVLTLFAAPPEATP